MVHDVVDLVQTIGKLGSDLWQHHWDAALKDLHQICSDLTAVLGTLQIILQFIPIVGEVTALVLITAAIVALATDVVGEVAFHDVSAGTIFGDALNLAPNLGNFADSEKVASGVAGSYAGGLRGAATNAGNAGNLLKEGELLDKAATVENLRQVEGNLNIYQKFAGIGEVRALQSGDAAVRTSFLSTRFNPVTLNPMGLKINYLTIKAVPQYVDLGRDTAKLIQDGTQPSPNISLDAYHVVKDLKDLSYPGGGH